MEWCWHINNSELFQKVGIIKETIIGETNVDNIDRWNFLIENRDIILFIAFDDNLKLSDDDFNIFVENDNDANYSISWDTFWKYLKSLKFSWWLHKWDEE